MKGKSDFVKAFKAQIEENRGTKILYFLSKSPEGPLKVYQGSSIEELVEYWEIESMPNKNAPLPRLKRKEHARRK